MRTLMLGHREVSELLPMADCIDLMAATLANLARGEDVLPLRQALWQPDRRGLLGLMPVYLANPPAIGAKVITVFPANLSTPFESHQGAVLLFDAANGRLLAVVDASAITAIRTAAVSAVATGLLANPEADDLAILGSGTQAAMHLAAMRAVRPIRRVRVWSRNPEHARRFAERESMAQGIDVQVMASGEAAVAGAAIVCTTTAATAPVLLGDWLTPGVHINAVGASSPRYRELDTAAVVHSRLFVDWRESAVNEADDYRVPLAEGSIGEAHIRGELGDLLLGRVPGRTDRKEITLFKSLGLAAEDLAAAQYLYARAEARNVGTWVEFSAGRHG